LATIPTIGASNQEQTVEKTITFFSSQSDNVVTSTDGIAREYWTRSTSSSASPRTIYIDEEGSPRNDWLYNTNSRYMRFMISM
jgi:hypothetical protein